MEGQGNTFLFVYDTAKSIHFLKCKDKKHEVYHYPDRLPVFGHGDFLSLEGNREGSCQTNGEAYQRP